MIAVIDNIAQSGVEGVCVTGGEPTLRTDLSIILCYLQQKRIVTSLSSNYFDFDGFEGLPIANARMSIYGGSRTHDEITRRKGSFARLERAAVSARRSGIPVYACMTVMKKNKDELPEVIRICRDWNIRKLVLFSLMPKGRGKEIYEVEHLQDVTSPLEQGLLSLSVQTLSVPGECAIIHPNGDLVASPYYPTGYEIIGNALATPITRLWERYPYKENYLAFNKRT